MFCIETKKREEHYQLTGGSKDRLSRTVSRINEVLRNHDITFEASDHVYNVVTKAVLEEKLAHQFLQVHEEGDRLMKSFVQERFAGSVSIWEPIPRRKLPTFGNNSKSTEIKVRDRVLTLREECRMLTRFTMASRERPGIDLPGYVGHYEFSVVPRSMFARDGTMHLCTDKASIMHAVEKISKVDFTPKVVSEPQGVIMFDGMAVVNQIKKSDAIRTCKDFAKVFVARVLHAAESYSEVQLIFDRYIASSLKGQTRDKRTGSVVTRFKISDHTLIDNVSLKTLLSHVETKKELTAYLSQKFVEACEQAGKKYVVVYENLSRFNVTVSSEVECHTHEEADTLLVLYGVDVAKINPFQELVVCSPDTDILLLLIFFYKSLPTRTVLRTGRGSNLYAISTSDQPSRPLEKKSQLPFSVFTALRVVIRRLDFTASQRHHAGRPLFAVLLWF